MCRLLGVSRAGFYAWECRAPCDRALEDAWLMERICAIHGESNGTYGSLRIHAELRLAHEMRIGKKRVERLMAAAVPRPAPQRSDAKAPLAEDLPGVDLLRRAVGGPRVCGELQRRVIADHDCDTAIAYGLRAGDT